MKLKIKIFLTVMILLGICTGCVIQKDNEDLSKSQNELEKNKITNLQTEENDSFKFSELEDEEKITIENYVNTICNRSRFLRIPEFENINNADREWIYSCLDRAKYITYATENEISENLKKLFGEELEIDINDDQNLISQNSISYIPKYDESAGKYFLPAFGMEYRILYTIDTIKKENDNYIVSVIEYCEQRDYEKNSESYLAICACNEEEPRNWKKIFEKDKNLIGTDVEIIEKVLERKKEFQTYNITLIRKNENIYLKSIEKVK